eukprot:5834532-Pyramimonas_sp.AAC.1
MRNPPGSKASWAHSFTNAPTVRCSGGPRADLGIPSDLTARSVTTRSVTPGLSGPWKRHGRFFTSSVSLFFCKFRRRCVTGSVAVLLSVPAP